jgi:hypothetical protein
MTPSKKSSTSFSQHDLLDACAQPGCPICRVGASSAKRYMKSMFNEYVNDITMRDNLLKSMGYCYEHTQLLLNVRIADALGASIIYENIVKKILREVPEQIKSTDFEKATARTKACPACEQRDDVFARSSFELGKSLGDEKMRSALEKSDGLCFPHLSQVLENAQNADNETFLLTLTKSKLEARQAEMAEVIRKSDHQFKDEKITQDEAIAWKKVISMISGVSISPTGE